MYPPAKLMRVHNMIPAPRRKENGKADKKKGKNVATHARLIHTVQRIK